MQRPPTPLFGSLLLLLALTLTLRAEVKPSPLFSDHMVLQSGMSIPIWGSASPGEKVTVTFLGQKESAVTGSDGRWMLRLARLRPGGPFEMTIAAANTIQIHDVLVGEVWIGSGQSNMVFTVSQKAQGFAGMLDEDKVIAAANYPRLRMFTVKDAKAYTPQTDMQGEWLVCSPETAGRFSAVGYLFSRDLQQALNVPVGFVTVAYGASTAEAWLPRPAIEPDPQLKPALDRFDALETFYKTHPGATSDQAPVSPQTLNARPSKPGPLRDPVQDQHQPTVLFNGMLNPVLPFAMRGVLWYQGESIVGGKAGVELYPHTMDTLVRDWRSLWGEGDFPFFAVQLAALKNASNNPAVREAQTKILALPNTALAITIDIGDPSNVHPKNKAPLGDRLTRIALAKTYGRKIEYSGPVLAGFQPKGDSLELHFAHADQGLIAKGGPLQTFEIAGEDRVFVPAEATIAGDTILVHSAQVAKPVAARYAWSNYPEGCNLYNSADLPAGPFRTDSWDTLTKISQEFTGK
jgi:sialate O-acetylesterase